MNQFLNKAEREFNQGKREIAASIGAGWIVPAAGQVVSGDIMYPAIASAVAYYTGMRYGLVAGYGAGALLYAVVVYNDLSKALKKYEAML